MGRECLRVRVTIAAVFQLNRTRPNIRNTKNCAPLCTTDVGGGSGGENGYLCNNTHCLVGPVRVEWVGVPSLASAEHVVYGIAFQRRGGAAAGRASWRDEAVTKEG